MTAKTPLPLAGAVAAVVIVVDQLTKFWADRRLTAGPCTALGDECVDVFWTLRFHLHYNTGAAFSTGRGLGPLFGIVAFIMAFVLFNLARNRTDRLGPVLLGAIAGGAIGNLIDRVARADDGFLSGAVIDFIDLQWWPIFNIADSAVVAGVIAFVVYSMFSPDAGTRPAVDATPGGGGGADGGAAEVTDGDESGADVERDAGSDTGGD